MSCDAPAMQTMTFAPTVPMATAREVHASILPHLQRSAVFRDYRSAFEITTGLPLALRAAGSLQAPLHGSRQANPFCQLMATKNKTCAACLQLQQRVEEGAGVEPKTLECYAGLNESAVPVRVDGRVAGYLQTGQVLLREPSRARFGEAARLLTDAGAATERRQAEWLYFRTRVVGRPHYESVLRMLAIFSHQLSALGDQLLAREAAGDSPVIVKARYFIAEHLGEDLSLTRLAQAVHVSPTYFCKVFHQEMGLTFTDYIARLRIEEVKRLLLDPDMRISEAAFAAGFQSLSQFNRVFHRIIGETPGDYRQRLHGAECRTRNDALVYAA